MTIFVCFSRDAGERGEKTAPREKLERRIIILNISPLSPAIPLLRKGDVNREKKAESIVFGWSRILVMVFYKDTPLNLKRTEKMIKASIASKIRRPII